MPRCHIVDPGFKVFAFDFANCIFRRDESDRDWRAEQAEADEDCAIGFVMKKYLGDGYVYRRSDEYEQLDYDFKGEWGPRISLGISLVLCTVKSTSSLADHHISQSLGLSRRSRDIF